MPELFVRPPLEPNAQTFHGVATVPPENMLVEPEPQFVAEVPIEAHGPHIPRHRSMETVSLRERWRVSTTRRKIGALATAATALLATGVVVFDATPAAADNNSVYTVVDTQNGVYARNSPHVNDTERKDGLGAYDGDRVQEICGVTNGDPVGERNNHTWHKVTDLNRPDEGVFWISDHWLNTPNSRNELTPGEPDCGNEDRPNPSNEAVPYKKIYDGNKAAAWGVEHAQDPQRYGVNDEDCTWFLSQALVAGGITQNDVFHLWGHYGFPHIPGTNIGSGAPGTATTWIAPKLIDYILKTYPYSTWKELSFDQNNQPDVKPGDIIAYDWYPKQGNGIDHLSIVVDDAPGTQYPEVAEWGNVRKTGMSASYSKRGWTWSETSNPPQWIAKATGGQAKAYVLHIDTGLDGVQVAN